MYNTLRSKIFYMVTIIIALTILSTSIQIQHGVKEYVLSSQEEYAVNLLNTVYLNVENQYGSLLFHEKSVLNRRKQELKNIVSMALSEVKRLYELYEKGALGEKEAKKRALETLRYMRYEDRVGYVWINDTRRPPHLVMHPLIPEFEGSELDDPRFYNAMGVDKHLLVAFLDVCMEKGAGYVDYLWPKHTPEGLSIDQPKLSYVSLFSPWNWIVGTGIYIDDIEREKKKRLEAILGDLDKTFKEVVIAETGYMYLFNGEGKMLIHPTLEKGSDLHSFINLKTGRNIFEDLMEAAKKPVGVFEYTWNKPSFDIESFEYEKIAYVKHFKPLDWYIASAIYKDEIEKPANELRGRILLFSVFPLLTAFILSFILSRTLSRPIQKLSHAAVEVEKKGLSSAVIPVEGTVEVRELGLTFGRMLKSVHRTEESLRQSEAQVNDIKNMLEDIINAMPSVIVGIDSGGLITSMNHAGESMASRPFNETLGENIGEVFPHVERFAGEMSSSVNSGDFIIWEKIDVTVGGVDRIYNIAAYPLTGNDHRGGVIRMDDVTEKVRMKEVLIQTEKMLSVGGLAAGMAHEINNPLAGIIQNAQVVRRRFSPDLRKNIEVAEKNDLSLKNVDSYMEQRGIHGMLNAILESGNRAAAVVGSMLAFSRKSSGVWEHHDLRKLLDNTLEIASSEYDLKTRYDFKSIDIVKKYGDDLPSVPCLKSEIQQVFLNLLRNGAHAMEEKYRDPETKGSPCFSLAVFEMNEMVCVEIGDNGCGMDETLRKQVFEPFFTTKVPGRGTGLGLSVSHFIVTEKHRGVMDVKSKPGEGTSFTICLPVAPVKE